MRFMKPVAAALAVTVGALSFAGDADARHRHRHYHHHHNGGDALVAGIIGLGAGAIIGGALAQPRYYSPAPVYVEPAPVYVAPAPVYYAPQPWTPEWYSYCGAKYRSFNPQNGYFLGYDGQYHFCR